MMNAKDWVTLIMRLAGVVLLVIALPASFSIIMSKVTLMINQSSGLSFPLSAATWMHGLSSVAQLMLGCYFLFGGKWLVKFLFRGLGGKEGLCPHCEYDVRGIDVDRCPECGKLIRTRAS